ncbi:hypothetical protein CVT26_008918 [Gymnopilus dilepis]|uniref:Helicase C-terminal domain-containing protein n=1 Tax=Gymnopilus dilepis TaxID=231916 RepID=A0A409YAL6_9AGAR|nr:hypothetical protein CVT26_008918 [Gymnopilus dilepis]
MIVSRAFYIEHRMSVGYARLSLEEKIPFFKSLPEWIEKMSTKMDTCARLCKHLLSRDDAPDPIIVDGQLVLPPLPPLAEGEEPQQTIKIIISQEFPSLAPLLRNVLKLYGLRNLAINGNMTYPNRSKTVKKFITDAMERILIMSSIGGCGLNLTCACAVILLDQHWSSQDEIQTIGRAHRQGQKRTVRVYHLLADETADIVLASLASGKRDMMEGFLNQARGQELLQLLRGEVVANEEDFEEDDEATDQPKSKKRPSQPKKKATKKGAKGDPAAGTGPGETPGVEMDKGEVKDVEQGQEKGLEREGEQRQEPQDDVASQKEPEVGGEPSKEPEMEGEQGKEPENEMVSPQGLEESGEPSRDPDNDKSMRTDDSESDGTIHGEATASGQSALSLCRYDSSDHEMDSPPPPVSRNSAELPSTPPRPSNFGERRPLPPSANSPEVRPTTKRPRIVDYQSSPASLFNQDEPIESPSPTRPPMPLRGSPPSPLLPAITLRTQKSQDQTSSPAIAANILQTMSQPVDEVRKTDGTRRSVSASQPGRFGLSSSTDRVARNASSAGPSSITAPLPQRGQRKLATVPTNRQPTLFRSQRKDDALSPPRASVSSKNPYGGRKKNAKG